jgi:hypothetical protein
MIQSEVSARALSLTSDISASVSKNQPRHIFLCDIKYQHTRMSLL